MNRHRSSQLPRQKRRRGVVLFPISELLRLHRQQEERRFAARLGNGAARS